MSHLLEQLVGPAPAGVPPNQRHLRSVDGIELCLLGNPQDDQLVLASFPGTLPADSAHALGSAQWSHSLPHPTREGIQLCVMVTPDDARVLLIDTWPRHSIDPRTFKQLLDEHARRHRHWLETLSSFDACDDAEEDLTTADDGIGTDSSTSPSPARFA